MENNNGNTQNKNTQSRSTQNRNTQSRNTQSRSNGSNTGNRNGSTNQNGKVPAKGKQNRTNKKPKHRSRFKRRLHWILLISSFVFSMTMLIGILIFYLKYGDDFSRYQKEADQLVGQSDLDTFRQTETHLVYDSNKKLISVLKGAKDVYYLKYEDIPGDAVEAMIAIEDKNFMKHAGIDLKA